jgi:very-short-patch-repair endonuclease
MRDREATRMIRELAERQHGVVAHRQVLELGGGEGLALRRREGGLLIPLHKGVYALGHQRLSKEGRWMAAVLACGPGAVLSHFSGGHLWNLCGSRGPVEVLRRSGGVKEGGHQGVRLHQTRRLESFEVTIERGIPVATIERILLDLAARTDAKRLERIFVQAYKSGQLSWSRLGRVFERRRGRKGIGMLRRVALEVDPQALDTRSVTEIDFLSLCRDAQLPTPSVNVFVGNHLVDFLWSAQKVVVETDSWSHHGDRPTFERDRQTDVDLIAAGYDVHRATYKMLERDPGPFLRNVRRALGARTASTSPPSR